ncbi:hypothetical protein [Stenotrophomonas cyclobalanopsidis]|uniref:hypothetical protein n=1 Tax=Stenotrophomonas cyclobalanopsidis TaxID=2771362 RepID=UPI0028A610A4|nr:hypothetical protein [Stenotrophomonas cyclobalanopsidis]
MLIFYFDEVKPNPDGQPFYWLGGLALKQEVIPEIEMDLAALGHDCFHTYDLLQSTELHARHLHWKSQLQALERSGQATGYP